jgi:putative glycosyltransferase
MKISIVTTMYNSALYVEEFYARILSSIQQITQEYEIIFVDDGSPDDAKDVVLSIQAKDQYVQVIELSRNFGHHKAMMTGLAAADGDYVFLIDCDLEEPPELLTAFYARLSDENVDVVYGVQPSRNDPWLNRITSGLFYRLFNVFADIDLQPNLLTVRLMRWDYVRALVAHKEQVMIIAALWQMTGFKQLGVEVEKQYKGATTYTLTRKLGIVFRSITATSNKPLVYIAYLGVFLTLTSLVYIVYLLVGYLLFGYGVDGWLSIIVSIWFFGGLNIFVMGIIALYLSVIFTEVKDRPYTVVRKHYRKE